MKQKVRAVQSDELCITHPEHGIALALDNGRMWCPHSEHDGVPARGKSAAIAATTPWLNKQQEVSVEAADA